MEIWLVGGGGRWCQNGLEFACGYPEAQMAKSLGTPCAFPATNVCVEDRCEFAGVHGRVKVPHTKGKRNQMPSTSHLRLYARQTLLVSERDFVHPFIHKITTSLATTKRHRLNESDSLALSIATPRKKGQPIVVDMYTRNERKKFCRFNNVCVAAGCPSSKLSSAIGVIRITLDFRSL